MQRLGKRTQQCILEVSYTINSYDYDAFIRMHSDASQGFGGDASSKSMFFRLERKEIPQHFWHEALVGPSAAHRNV